MTSDIICIHQGEDGTVCGHTVWTRVNEPQHHEGPPGFGCDTLGCHPFVPGRKCPTCDGSGKKIRGQDIDLITGFPLGDRQPCPTCAASPVRGYLEVK